MSRRPYVDASALVKLVLDEPESTTLRLYLAADGPPVTSRIATVEVRRAIGRVVEMTEAYESAVATVFTATDIVELDIGLADRAARIGPPTLRTLDAIHLATALALRDELAAFVTYDGRQAEAARSLGLEVVAPA